LDSAYQGEEGVYLVNKALEEGRPYAMAFLDVRMPPGMGGVETAQKIWAIDSEIQIVLCTAYSDASWEEMLEKIGGNDRMVILKKPFESVEAFQLANAFTEKWTLSRQAQSKLKELEGLVASRTHELQRSNNTLQMQALVIESMAEAVVIADAQMRIIATNPAGDRMFGYSSEELIGQNVSALCNLDDETCRRAFGDALNMLQQGLNWSGEINRRRKDGTPMVVRAQISVFELDGKRHFFSVEEDVTQRKQFEAKWAQSQKLETVGKLAGGVAHEFNSIMTAIIGQSELLLTDLRAEDSLRKHVIEIRQAAERAAILTRQLLAYGRKQILQPEILDLNMILADMGTMLSHLAGNRVEVRCLPFLGLTKVKVDAGQIEKVIINMVINAAEAMPNGGKLTLETANVAVGDNYVSHFPELKSGDYAMLAITDTGMGMSAETKERIFEPFFSTKEVGQGTGLGLSTCYGILKQSGGHITVSSELARGTTFKIYLPAAQAPANTPVQIPEIPHLPKGTETILLVEEDPALRDMAGTLLGRLGYTVWTASNGVEALSLIHQLGRGHVDLLFTEVVMPHMSGKELWDRVRSSHPSSRILFTSANMENTMIQEEGFSEGAAVLQKPFSPSGLAVKVREVLDQFDGEK